jgi:hypothetical protein
LLDEPVDELTSELAPEEERFADLPLWYAPLVAPPTWDEPSRATEPEPCTRLFWRATVSRWSIERRQAWGDRANALQDAGLGWKDAERTAFEEIMASPWLARR